MSSHTDKKPQSEASVDSSNDLGPLETLLSDEQVSEILVDGPKRIYVERQGQLEDTPLQFRDDQHLLEIIRRIAEPLGRNIDKEGPLLDMRLADGTLVNVVLPPVSLVGPVLTLRKFDKEPIMLEDLIRFGSVSQELIDFIRACVQARLNIAVAGGTGSGKTTILNLIVAMIPSQERIIVVERIAELQLPATFKRVVRLESRAPDSEGKGEVTLQDLVMNAVKMRPDRIISGEVIGAEVLGLFQAMSTGHDGSMMTLHANNVRDALSRLEMMVGFANTSLPVLAVRELMASALDLVIYQKRLPDGRRKVVKITEVAGMQGDVVSLQDIFEFRETGSKDGRLTGHFTATGHIPRFLDRLQAAGIELPLSLFTPS